MVPVTQNMSDWLHPQRLGTVINRLIYHINCLSILLRTLMEMVREILRVLPKN